VADIKINEKLVVSQTGTAEPVLASNVDLSNVNLSSTTIPAAGVTGTLGSGVTLPDQIGEWKPLGQIKLTTATDKVYFVNGLAPQGNDGTTYTSVASTVVWDTTYPLYKLNWFINGATATNLFPKIRICTSAHGSNAKDSTFATSGYRTMTWQRAWYNSAWLDETGTYTDCIWRPRNGAKIDMVHIAELTFSGIKSSAYPVCFGREAGSAYTSSSSHFFGGDCHGRFETTGTYYGIQIMEVDNTGSFQTGSVFSLSGLYTG